LDGLCRAIEEALHFRAWANLYLTPLHSQAFPPHYDPHDTFVLQIAGEKLWEIRPPVYERPLGDARFDLPEKLPGEPQRLRLKPGDLLYFPAGTIHEVFALDKFTLHITIGVQPCTWLDLVNAFLRSLAESNINFRESLPPRFLNDAPFQQQVVHHLNMLLRQAADVTNIPGGMSELARRTIGELELCRDNRFEVLTRVEEIHASTALRKRAGMICFAEKNGDRVILYFRGGVFSGPVKIMPAIEHIISANIFTPQTLPGLSDASRLVLSKRLVKDGLLTLAGT
jgi:ribosomal protein L16 Arg81 hydroxylase